MTDQQYNSILAAINALAKNTIPPNAWESYLVGSGQTKLAAPTPAESSHNPGKYYKTEFDPMKGDVPFPVVELFDENVVTDSEGNVTRKFIGGTLYQWAKADLPTFLRYYQHRYKHPLNLDNLHPEQRALMGL